MGSLQRMWLESEDNLGVNCIKLREATIQALKKKKTNTQLEGSWVQVWRSFLGATVKDSSPAPETWIGFSFPDSELEEHVEVSF